MAAGSVARAGVEAGHTPWHKPSAICLWGQERSCRLTALSYECRVTSQGAALCHRARHGAMASALMIAVLVWFSLSPIPR